MIKKFNEGGFIKFLEVLALTPGPSLGEEPRRKVLETFFKDHDVKTETDSAGNLFVKIGYGPFENTVVFDAHMDVVQHGYCDSVMSENGYIKGLGVADNLTAVSLLAFMAVCINENRDKIKRPVVFLFSTGEEGDGNLKGVRQFVEDHKLPPLLFLSFDLSMEEYSVQGLGSFRYSVNVNGQGGHSWEDYGNVSSIDVLLEFFNALKKKFNQVLSEKPGTVSFNIGTIKGGEGINSISKKAAATFEFRSVCKETLDELDCHVTDLCNFLNSREDISFDCSITGKRPAAVPVDPASAEQTILSVFKRLGVNTSPVIRSTNINATLEAGWPSISLGLCRSGRFHTDDEFVEIKSVSTGWEILSLLVENFIFKTNHYGHI